MGACTVASTLKKSACLHPHSQIRTRVRYEAMRDALNATGRPITFSMCEWGSSSAWTYGGQVLPSVILEQCTFTAAKMYGNALCWQPEITKQVLGCAEAQTRCNRAACWHIGGNSNDNAGVESAEGRARGTQVGNTWRTTPDIAPGWNSVMSNLDGTVGLSRYAGPGAWNDADMLEVPDLQHNAACDLHPLKALVRLARRSDSRV